MSYRRNRGKGEWRCSKGRGFLEQSPPAGRRLSIPRWGPLSCTAVNSVRGSGLRDKVRQGLNIAHLLGSCCGHQILSTCLKAESATVLGTSRSEEAG